MKLALRQSKLGYFLTTLDIQFQTIAAGARVHKKYFDLREKTRGKISSLDLKRHAQANAIFIHIPKCGGTSIEDQVPFHTGHRSILYYYAANRALADRLFKFTIVRNPYDRLVSGFHWLRFHTKGYLDQKWAHDNIAQFKNFHEFMEGLQDKGFQNAIRSWILFAPQWYFVCDKAGNILVDFVGRIEAFDEMVATVNDKTNLKLVNVKKKTSSREHFSKYFSRTDERIVLDMYGRDFEIFSYNSLR